MVDGTAEVGVMVNDLPWVLKILPFHQHLSIINSIIYSY
jgi:hypothetical protein